MPVAAARRLQSVRNERTLWHMRIVALLAVVLCASPAVAGRRTSFHVGADSRPVPSGGGTTTVPLYGRIFALQDAAVGSYSDTIVVTFNF